MSLRQSGKSRNIRKNFKHLHSIPTRGREFIEHNHVLRLTAFLRRSGASSNQIERHRVPSKGQQSVGRNATQARYPYFYFFFWVIPKRFIKEFIFHFLLHRIAV